MKPPQQDNEAKKESDVYVQKPDGEEVMMNKSPGHSGQSPEDAKQTADNIPTKASGEVTDGEDG